MNTLVNPYGTFSISGDEALKCYLIFKGNAFDMTCEDLIEAVKLCL